MILRFFRFLTVAAFLSLTVFANAKSDFVRVEDGRFMIGDKPYNYVGTNFWYGAILGSEGRGGNRERLAKELDLLQANGIDNIRVLVGGDGEENIPSHVMPVLQTAPGVYNDTILDGLDYLMAELERRDMKAILFLNNAWEWSGGYGTYLEWATGKKTPNPAIDGYDKYMAYAANFVKNKKAKQLAANHVRNMVTRTNRYTGKPYSESPALMSWQIANEPRAFASDPKTKEAFADWISEQAALIKSLDPAHLVSTGSEGSHGCEQDIDLWEKIHSDPNIDYAIMHLWPYNWGWVNEQNLVSNVEEACNKADDYIMAHNERAALNGKPLVIEEFGYPRDGFIFTPGSPTEGRDKFYRHIFSLVEANDNINGCNFWSWGGYAEPAHEFWQAWDDYTGDPAQEAQGLNSVFAKDTSTLAVIKNANTRLRYPHPENTVSQPDTLPGFDAFWRNAIAELDAIPMNATMREIPEKSGEKRKIYFCQYLSLDNDTVSGYLALPVKPGKYPAIIYYNGYNGEPWDMDPDGMPEWIEFQHWVRGQGPNKPYNRYDDYIQYNLDNPEKYYYRGAYMDALRTIDFIESLPQTDRDNIFAEGGSQGGAFTFVAAALDPKKRLRAIAPYIPFMSDFPNYFRIAPWPGDVVKQKAAELGLDDETLYRNLSYFDIKNLTPRITVPVLMGVGGVDPTCPPAINFAAYNNLCPCLEKQYVIYPECGHTVDYDDWNPRRLAFFLSHKR